MTAATTAQITYINTLQTLAAATYDVTPGQPDPFIRPAMAWVNRFCYPGVAARVPEVAAQLKAGTITRKQATDAIADMMRTTLAADLAADAATLTKAEASALIDRLTGKAL